MHPQSHPQHQKSGISDRSNRSETRYHKGRRLNTA